MFNKDIMLIAAKRAHVIRKAMVPDFDFNVKALEESLTPAEFIQIMPFNCKNGEILILDTNLNIGLKIYLHNAEVKMITPVETISCAQTRAVVTMMINSDLLSLERQRAAIFAVPYLETNYGRDIWDEINVTRGDICSISLNLDDEVRLELKARLELSAGIFGKEFVYSNCSAHKPFIECYFTDENVNNFIHLFSKTEYCANDKFMYSIVESEEDGAFYLLDLSTSQHITDPGVIYFSPDLSKALKDKLINSKHLNNTFKINPNNPSIDCSMRKYLQQNF